MPQHALKFLQYKLPPHVEGITAMPGVVVVAMAYPNEVESGLILPYKESLRRWPDVGRVVAVGSRYEGKWLGKLVVSDPGDLKVGDTVLVRGDRGYCVTGFGRGDVAETDAELRFYGTNGGPGTHALFGRYDAADAVMAKIEADTLKARGKNVVVRMGIIPEKSQGGIHLIKSIYNKEVIGTVTSVGEFATKPIGVGDRVIVCGNSFHEILNENDEGLAVCHEDAILAVV